MRCTNAIQRNQPSKLSQPSVAWFVPSGLEARAPNTHPQRGNIAGTENKQIKELPDCRLIVNTQGSVFWIGPMPRE
ncbi:MAG: hypothetical protein CTY31_07350 [Hyphomicrobium sp.]|nr:MAG: hypothetical protein CTY31_07350 [Hyphomicrobium sp.]